MEKKFPTDSDEDEATRVVEAYEDFDNEAPTAVASKSDADGAATAVDRVPFRGDDKPTTAKPGMVLGWRYRLGELLGEGGMGKVFGATLTGLASKKLVVKVLHPEFAEREDSLQRFQREADAVAMLDGHENIVTVLDRGQDDVTGLFYIVMEYLNGCTLETHMLQRGGPLSEPDAIAIVLPVLSALAFAHSKGVVHRDVKPANIFLVKRPGGRTDVKVLDFGIAKMTEGDASTNVKLTKDRDMLGTVHYMSPEQAMGKKSVDLRSDLYSVAAMLYEMVSGRCPFGDSDEDRAMENRNALNYKVVVGLMTKAATPILSIQPGLWHVIAKGLAKEPEDRYASAEAMAQALNALLPLYGKVAPEAPLQIESLSEAPPAPASLKGAPTEALLGTSSDRRHISQLQRSPHRRSVILAAAAFLTALVVTVIGVRLFSRPVTAPLPAVRPTPVTAPLADAARPIAPLPEPTASAPPPLPEPVAAPLAHQPNVTAPAPVVPRRFIRPRRPVRTRPPLAPTTCAREINGIRILIPCPTRSR
ncbi:MAG: protein kinase [Patescibacteria group bacterium]